MMIKLHSWSMVSMTAATFRDNSTNNISLATTLRGRFVTRSARESQKHNKLIPLSVKFIRIRRVKRAGKGRKLYLKAVLDQIQYQFCKHRENAGKGTRTTFKYARLLIMNEIYLFSLKRDLARSKTFFFLTSLKRLFRPFSMLWKPEISSVRRSTATS